MFITTSQSGGTNKAAVRAGFKHTVLYTATSTESEAAREGFPHLTGAEFVALFIRHMRVEPTKIITRLEFRRIS